MYYEVQIYQKHQRRKYPILIEILNNRRGRRLRNCNRKVCPINVYN